MHVSMWKVKFGWCGFGLLRVCFCVVVRVCLCMFQCERLVLDGMLLASVVTLLCCGEGVPMLLPGFARTMPGPRSWRMCLGGFGAKL